MGNADLNKDGHTTLGELTEFLDKTYVPESYGYRLPGAAAARPRSPAAAAWLVGAPAHEHVHARRAPARHLECHTLTLSRPSICIL
jgi:hypothetical protein